MPDLSDVGPPATGPGLPQRMEETPPPPTKERGTNLRLQTRRKMGDDGLYNVYLEASQRCREGHETPMTLPGLLHMTSGDTLPSQSL